MVVGTAIATGRERTAQDNHKDVLPSTFSHTLTIFMASNFIIVDRICQTGIIKLTLAPFIA